MKKFLTKTGQLGLPQKGKKQASNLQSKALNYIPSSLCSITAQSGLGM